MAVLRNKPRWCKWRGVQLVTFCPNLRLTGQWEGQLPATSRCLLTLRQEPHLGHEGWLSAIWDSFSMWEPSPVWPWDWGLMFWEKVLPVLIFRLWWVYFGSSLDHLFSETHVCSVEAFSLWSPAYTGRLGPAGRPSRITTSSTLTKVVSFKLFECFEKENWKTKNNSCPHVLGRCGIVSKCLVCRDSVPSFLETA